MDNDDDIIIAIDSTGIKVTNRGQWMQEKWQLKKERVSKDPHCRKYQDQRNT